MCEREINSASPPSREDLTSACPVVGSPTWTSSPYPPSSLFRPWQSLWPGRELGGTDSKAEGLGRKDTR